MYTQIQQPYISKIGQSADLSIYRNHQIYKKNCSGHCVLLVLAVGDRIEMYEGSSK
jgi:hypothetical protein